MEAKHMIPFLSQLQAEKKQLLEELDVLECELLFAKWSGIRIKTPSDFDFHAEFTPMIYGTFCGKSKLHLKKTTKDWEVVYCDLPFSCGIIPLRFKDAPVVSASVLRTLTSCFMHEANLFYYRKKQFEDAMAVLPPDVRLYPSSNTLWAMLFIQVVKWSGISQVFVTLQYDRDSFLPQKVLLEIKGGNEKEQEDMRRKFEVLKEKPLQVVLRSSLFHQS